MELIFKVLVAIIVIWPIRSVIDTKESDGIVDPMEKIAIKSHSDHSDSGIGKILILIDSHFVIILQCNKMTK